MTSSPAACSGTRSPGDAHGVTSAHVRPIRTEECRPGDRAVPFSTMEIRGTADLFGELRQSGYVLVRQVLAHDDLKSLREAFVGAGDGSTEHVEVNDSTPNPIVWRTLLDREPVRTLAATALHHPSVASVHGRNPGRSGGEQGLHADLPPDPGGELSSITMLWMLDDFTVDNGATRVVAGTHLRRTAVPRDYAQPGRRHPDEVLASGSAGDVLVLDAHLWHAGRCNISGNPRRAVQMTVVGERLSAST